MIARLFALLALILAAICATPASAQSAPGPGLTLIGTVPVTSNPCVNIYLQLALSGGQNCQAQAAIASYTNATAWTYTPPTLTGTGANGSDVIGTDGTVHDFASGANRIIAGEGIYLDPYASTNLQLHSQVFTGAFWGSCCGGSQTTGQTAPDGTSTATLLSGGGQLQCQAGSACVTASLTNSTFYVSGIFCKPTGATPDCEIYYNEANSVTTFDQTGWDCVTATLTCNQYLSQNITNDSATITPLANGWYLVQTTFKTPASGTITSGGLNVDSGSTAGSASRDVWGAQTELCPTAAACSLTSYIPTTTASVARAADVLSVTGQTGANCVGFINFGNFNNPNGQAPIFPCANSTIALGSASAGSWVNGMVLASVVESANQTPSFSIASAVSFNTSTLTVPVSGFTTSNVDMGLTYASGFSLYRTNFFGLTPTGHVGSATGSISGTTLTIPGAVTGWFVPGIGQPISGTGVTAGTTLVAQLTSGIIGTVSATVPVTTASTQMTLQAACPSGLSTGQEILDTTNSSLISFVGSSSGTPCVVIFAGTLKAVHAAAINDAISFLNKGQGSTYQVSVSQTVASTTVTAASVWINDGSVAGIPAGTLSCGQDANTFNQTCGSAGHNAGNPQTIVGTGFGGGAFFLYLTKHTVGIPWDGQGWPSKWTDGLAHDAGQDSGTLQVSWPAQTHGSYLQWAEPDDICEDFQGQFSTTPGQCVKTFHYHYDAGLNSDVTNQQSYINDGNWHLEAALWNPTAHTMKYYVDGIQVGKTVSWGAFVADTVHANASCTTGVATCALTLACPADLSSGGFTAYDTTQSATLSTNAACSGSNLTSAGGNWSHAITSGDAIVVAETPPPSISGNAYAFHDLDPSADGTWPGSPLLLDIGSNPHVPYVLGGIWVHQPNSASNVTH